MNFNYKWENPHKEKWKYKELKIGEKSIENSKILQEHQCLINTIPEEENKDNE